MKETSIEGEGKMKKKETTKIGKNRKDDVFDIGYLGREDLRRESGNWPRIVRTRRRTKEEETSGKTKEAQQAAREGYAGGRGHIRKAEAENTGTGSESGRRKEEEEEEEDEEKEEQETRQGKAEREAEQRRWLTASPAGCLAARDVYRERAGHMGEQGCEHECPVAVEGPHRCRP